MQIFRPWPPRVLGGPPNAISDEATTNAGICNAMVVLTPSQAAQT
jgi:hypothetical protein